MTREREKSPRASSGAATSALQEPVPAPASLWPDVEHFAPREFTCRCDGLCDHPSVISPELVVALDRVRKRLGVPIRILSATRCERHNRKVGGSAHSAHLAKDGISHAADVHCPDSGFRFAFLREALPLFKRIGVGKDFIHVDNDPTLPAAVVWLYGPDRLPADNVPAPKTGG